MKSTYSNVLNWTEYAFLNYSINSVWNINIQMMNIKPNQSGELSLKFMTKLSSNKAEEAMFLLTLI